MDWLTLLIGVALIATGIFYYRRADTSADETRTGDAWARPSWPGWQLSPTAFRAMAIVMILAGCLDLGALIVVPLAHGGGR